MILLVFHVLTDLATLGVRYFASRGSSQPCRVDVATTNAATFLRLREGKPFLVETERLTKAGQPVAPPCL